MKTLIQTCLVLVMLCLAKPLAFAQQTIDIVYIKTGDATVDTQTLASLEDTVQRLNDGSNNSGDYYRLQTVDGKDELDDFAQSADAGDKVYAVTHGDYTYNQATDAYFYDGTVNTKEDGKIDGDTFDTDTHIDGFYHCGVIDVGVDENVDGQGRPAVGEVTTDDVGRDIASQNNDSYTGADGYSVYSYDDGFDYDDGDFGNYYDDCGDGW